MTATMPMTPLRLPDASGYTVDDLHALPDDGRRYELIDGSIIVSPSATFGHNAVARWIANQLELSAPEHLIVGTDQSSTIDDHNEPRPDVVVALARNLSRTPFPMADAVLTVEVVSPTSGLRDRQDKRALYARAGVPSYWLIEPDERTATIRLTEFVLGDAKEYSRLGTWSTGMFRTDRPWPLEIDLGALSARLARLARSAGEDV